MITAAITEPRSAELSDTPQIAVADAGYWNEQHMDQSWILDIDSARDDDVNADRCSRPFMAFDDALCRAARESGARGGDRFSL